MTAPSSNTPEGLLRLARMWQFKGKWERAIALYQQVLHLQPDCIPAYLSLGNILEQQDRLSEALKYYEKALSINPKAMDVLKSYDETKNRLVKVFTLPNNPDGKINLTNQKTFDCHRSGWNFVFKALQPLHNSQGILFDGFLENNFAWKHQFSGLRSPEILSKMKKDGSFEHLATSEEKGITPYRQPWVGFLHNPQNMPTWFHYQESPQIIFAKDIWKISLDYCIGLFTLSEYHATWLREQTGKPVDSLIYPTEIPEIQFDFQKFLANPQKKIVQVGWWLRRLNSIYQLPIPKNNLLNYKKIRLVPLVVKNFGDYLWKLMDEENQKENLQIDEKYAVNTREVQHLSNLEYDILLSENIVFIDLYDASANTVVVECLARATPLLINPLPAVIEYLGENYPMYFNSLSEAAEKALDTQLIWETYHYLKNWKLRDKLSAEYFGKSFQESEVYQLI